MVASAPFSDCKIGNNLMLFLARLKLNLWLGLGLLRFVKGEISGELRRIIGHFSLYS